MQILSRKMAVLLLGFSSLLVVSALPLKDGTALNTLGVTTNNDAPVVAAAATEAWTETDVVDFVINFWGYWGLDQEAPFTALGTATSSFLLPYVNKTFTGVDGLWSQLRAALPQGELPWEVSGATHMLLCMSPCLRALHSCARCA